MKYNFLIRFLMGLLVLQTSCKKQIENKEIDTEELIEQVNNQVKAFHTADTSLNAKGVIDLLWPEFIMLVDGKYIAYEGVKSGSESFMASLEIFHTEWKDLKIIPIGNDHAISSFIFTDSLVAKNGTITQSKGPNTFVWEKRNGHWRVIYADADHYPIK